MQPVTQFQQGRAQRRRALNQPPKKQARHLLRALFPARTARRRSLLILQRGCGAFCANRCKMERCEGLTEAGTARLQPPPDLIAENRGDCTPCLSCTCCKPGQG